MMIPIPHEVWLQIAKHVPPDHLRNLLSVNSALFDEAMNIRYGRVHVANDPHTVKLIQ